jgi:ribosome-associated protein
MTKITLPASDAELLAQCSFEAYRASGRGGQHTNVTDSAVRLVHRPTGLVVTSQKTRSQYLNKQECLTKLRRAVKKLNYKQPKRVATRMPRSVKIKNRARKMKASKKKNLRQPLSFED